MSSIRAQYIQDKLTQALEPTLLEIIDESHKHIGHAGSQSGGSHFAVVIASPHFVDKSLLECHRLIYDALGDAIGKEIHALKIKIKHT